MLTMLQRQTLCSQNFIPQIASRNSSLVLFFSFLKFLLFLAFRLIERIPELFCNESALKYFSLLATYWLKLKPLSSIWFQAFWYSSFALGSFQHLPGTGISVFFTESLAGSRLLPLLCSVPCAASVSWNEFDWGQDCGGVLSLVDRVLRGTMPRRQMRMSSQTYGCLPGLFAWALY